MLQGQGGIDSVRMAPPEHAPEKSKSLSVTRTPLEHSDFLWHRRPLLCSEETEGSSSHPFPLSLIAFFRFPVTVPVKKYPARDGVCSCKDQGPTKWMD